MAGRGDELAAYGVHLSQRANHACVAVVVGKLAACETGARGWFCTYYLIVGFASEHFAEEGCCKATEVAATTGAGDEDVGLDVVLLECLLCFESDDCLVEQYLVEHAAQFVAIAFVVDCCFYGFGYGASQRACCAGVFGQNLASNLCRVAGGGDNACAKGAYYFAAEGFLLV